MLAPVPRWLKVQYLNRFFPNCRWFAVGDSYLAGRLALLRGAQNPDGGWGYFAKKQSWLEPTAYAAMALAGEPAADRAWMLLRSWQAGDGGLGPSAEVHVPHWDTALFVTLAVARGESGDGLRRGVDWLLDSAGVESNLINRVAARIGILDAGRDLSLKGWPWKPNTSSWVEPTAHTLVALKRASSKISKRGLDERVRMGEAQLLNVRCRDGGWNYGSPEARGVDLPSYPETTALALIGLQGRMGLEPSIDLARRVAAETPSRLARAWVAIALRLHDSAAPASELSGPTGDVLITALEALGAAEGNFAFLRTSQADGLKAGRVA